ncbi:LysE/ArgO family amino acid transporter [Kocuria sp.]|uniref:LysE/ArgO family amino acid transporter n=1 Tax=Kocuria sp. TaxID=1871328 RepID=UPI0026E09516|nr:LysE/ArgO family amino acid transporter [Kocuria sp.]MDO5619015.1 LysE/ArgO family amino acid transporter [Kocuria sp.]
MGIFFTGMLAGLALIIAIGAQNAWVLRQGIRREHVAIVVVVCAVADAVLITVGTLGIGTLVERFPGVLVALRWGGAAYLIWFAVQSFRSAFSNQSLKQADGAVAAKSAGRVLATTLALTFLNPHVYLDTVVMLGNLANQQGDLRWMFAGGAAMGSVLWFSVLGIGARALAKPLNRPGTWKVIDVGVGVVMLLIAAKLVFMG